ncbi:Zn-ribbon domain-containing OB-fold protein [Nocardioides alcanivorans]|uniref:Zn-ribbon domain-containing OB-fold protein n=1 Tax=Nocardioides alcanivorans TaxID=2897352 RepID=UPI001F1A3F90|nr:Zn-ribbon domain-containing OB-fold protein [Nocardioides alcanivorans]
MTHRPLPDPTPLTEGFWAAAGNHELVAQRCANCDVLRHYPRPLCPSCASTEWHWHRLGGHGTVYTYTVTHRAFHPAWADQVPYAVVTVDLDEGVRMVGQLHGADPARVQIGARVEVRFEEYGGPDGRSMTLPGFQLCPDPAPTPVRSSVQPTPARQSKE